MSAVRQSVVTELCKIVSPSKANEIELGIYNWAITFARSHNMNRTWSNLNFKNCYIQRAFAIACNVNPNAYVNNTYISNRLDKVDISNFTPHQLFPEAWSAHFECLKVKEEKALNKDKLPTTDRFTCPKCKGNECVYHIMQIRSGDEGSTIFVSCNKCMHNWRIN